MAARKRDRRGRFVRSDPDGPAPSPDETRARTAAASTSGEGASRGATKAMATPVKMPELGESITEGTITRWLKQEGDRVEADEPLFEVSTDKVDTEVPSPVAGILTSIKVKEDETVEVGAELAVVSTGGAGGGTAEARPREAEEAARAAGEERDGEERGAREEARPAAAAGDGAAGDGAGGAVVSPLVRRLAREHGIDLRRVKGSGSGGRVRREDIEAYLERQGGERAEAPAAPAAAAREEAPAPRTGDGRAAPAPAPAREGRPAA